MARDIQVIHLTSNKQLEQGEDIKKARLLGPEDADSLELRLSDLTKKSADLQEAAQRKELRLPSVFQTLSTLVRFRLKTHTFRIRSAYSPKTHRFENAVESEYK